MAATHTGKALEWKISDSGTSAIFGDLGTQATPGDGVMTEPGSAFTIQTATFIPEPSTSLLALLGGMLGFLHRPPIMNGIVREADR